MSLLLRKGIANPRKHKSLERCRRNTPISVQGPNDIYFLGRVVKHERIGERERGLERKKEACWKYGKGRNRKSDQNLESGLVFSNGQVRTISFVNQHANRNNPKQSTHRLHMHINTCPV
jgi:hypothetical protein